MALFLSIGAQATHIVGGEFEMQHLNGYNYRLTLNLYFDNINGNPGALDQSIVVSIFSKANNQLLRTQVMYLKNQSFVPYTNIDCTAGELSTKRLVYYETLYLDPNIYNDPAGYYVTWERCCRNNTINNIVSPESAAQTFYMEFPPVIKDGSFFRNSSPVLFPPLSDYACVNELFYFDFNGTDPDGDSIVYDMVTPLNGYTTPSMPVYTTWPLPAPYPTVRWQPGYNAVTQVQGNPPMSIDRQTGQLTMRPRQKGLFVFGVRAQEYRNGKKIGEVRRDFQVLVLDCPRNASPQVLAAAEGQKDFYQENEVLRITPTDSRCVNIFFTDPDFSEFVSLRARPVNFSSQDYTFEGKTSGNINQGSATDTLTATLCFAECFDTEGKVFKLDLIVEDDGCSLPRQDTLQVSFVIAPIQDTPPEISLSTPERLFSVKDGDQLTFDVLGTDPDEDVVSIKAVGQNFSLDGQDITFEDRSGTGSVTSPFTWNISCDAMKQDSYKIDFIVESIVCNELKSRKVTVEVKPENNNTPPAISTDQTATVIELEAGQPFEAKVFGKDVDLDLLMLSAQGEGFNLADYGMQFVSTGSNGSAQGTFSWTPTCDAFQAGALKVNFNLTEDVCAPSAAQQLALEFRIKDTNTPPTLTSDKEVLRFDLALNEPFEAKLFGEDMDLDNLILTATGEGFNLADYGMTFNSTNGSGEANGTFNWIASCLGTEQEMVRVNFTLAEEACDPSPQEITMEFRVKAPSINDFVPANLFTPNGDGRNDFFEVPGLPTEFCSATFTSIRVFNRWGKEVYSSNQSDFKWDGAGVNDGVYFYVIDYNTSKFKGSVTIVR
ncbi:gliding motility-associated C-terminal domain-containing protein [Pontibacter ummariensis]|uniref:gliding motility-associated C-terminal domain-containing protein n=1 Tax=Pontibacter ummariensis TaxID=1610492 RepID=UPI0015C65AE0|nr:gliding motility-associated C-terminal domain-containing protein [Pontibacter ummariensis]